LSIDSLLRPLAYVVRPVFTELEWYRPIYAEREPGTENLIMIQKSGNKDSLEHAESQ